MNAVDYTIPENYAVDYFVAHRVSQKKGHGGYELKARWKAYNEDADTWEPLTNQAEDNPTLLLDYLSSIDSEHKAAIIASVHAKKDMFPDDFLKKMKQKQC